MKKLSLLAASVAVALTGCGGGDGSGSSTSSSSSNTDTVSIRAADGYLKNAIMFIDSDENGSWDVNDIFLGITDENGLVDVGSTKPTGILAVQTITPGGDKQKKLLSIDPLKYAGLYTVDMDLPGQPMGHEVVFRAPNESNFISPITDLITIEMSNGRSLEEAKEAVVSALGAGENFDPYSNFVEEADDGDQHAINIHKIAQILTESKAADVLNNSTFDDDVSNESISKALKVAKKAKELVEQMDENDKLADEYVTIINPEDIDNPPPLTHSTSVNKAVFDEIQGAFDQLNLEIGSTVIDNNHLFSIDISKLFIDKDLIKDNTQLDLEEISLNTNRESYVEGARLSELKAYTDFNQDTNTLILNVGLVPKEAVSIAGEFELVISLSGEQVETTATTARFTWEVENGNIEAPSYNENILSIIEDNIEAWELIQGQPLASGYELDLSGLFSDDLTISFSSNAVFNGLTFDDMGDQKIGIQGKPLRSKQQDNTDYTIKIIATDDDTGLSTTVEFDLPDVQSSPIQECKENDGYWYENQCNDEPQVAKFTPNHFEKSGDWVMGSFDYGDSEMALASLRMEGKDYLFCFAANDGNTTLSKQSWRNWLTDIKTDTIESNDCHSVDLNQDGTLTLGDDSQFSLVYEHVDVSEDSTEYKLIFTTNDGELFWLDSDTADLTSFNSPIANNNIVEHFLIDDRTNYNEIEPMIDSLAYTVTSGSDNGIPRSGTLGLESDHANQNFTGLWDVNQDSIGTTRLRFTDIDFGDGPEDISRLRYNYRDFGVLNIGIGDSDKNNGIGNQLGDHAFFYISSENKDELLKVYNAWVEANDD